MEPSEQNEFYRDHVSIIAHSYYQQVGRQIPLGQTGYGRLEVDSAKALFNAPFALISHGTESEPIFNYANRTAMRLFNMTWNEIITLQSRYSAEQPNRQQRSHFLNEVKTHGYIDNYCGIRIAKGGRRFQIEQATVWNLIDNNGDYYGQAAMFSHWRFV